MRSSSLAILMKGKTGNGFGPRLAHLRKGRGLTQQELADRLGISRRVIIYYEQEDAQPPGAMLADLAKVLRVSADQLLGLKQVKNATSPRTARLVKRLEKIEQIPPADQRALFKVLDAMLEKHGVNKKSG